MTIFRINWHEMYCVDTSPGRARFGCMQTISYNCNLQGYSSKISAYEFSLVYKTNCWIERAHFVESVTCFTKDRTCAEKFELVKLFPSVAIRYCSHFIGYSNRHNMCIGQTQ